MKSVKINPENTLKHAKLTDLEKADRVKGQKHCTDKTPLISDCARDILIDGIEQRYPTDLS